jgi:SsrA-binding protein
MDDTKAATKNRKAFHNFQIIESLEAGIALQGTEVKSIREGKVNLKESFARIIKGEAYLINCHISQYSHGNINNHNPVRDRKLLLHKSEINRLIGKMNKKGLTLVPLSMYFKGGKVKVEIALAKGKREYDHREDIKKRDLQREEKRYKISM